MGKRGNTEGIPRPLSMAESRSTVSEIRARGLTQRRISKRQTNRKTEAARSWEFAVGMEQKKTSRGLSVHGRPRRPKCYVEVGIVAPRSKLRCERSLPRWRPCGNLWWRRSLVSLTVQYPDSVTDHLGRAIVRDGVATDSCESPISITPYLVQILQGRSTISQLCLYCESMVGHGMYQNELILEMWAE